MIIYSCSCDLAVAYLAVTVDVEHISLALALALIVWYARPGTLTYPRTSSECNACRMAINPLSGEVFESIIECERRLKGYTLAEGFDTVRIGAGSEGDPGRRWKCIFHGDQTRNYRGLRNMLRGTKKTRLSQNVSVRVLMFSKLAILIS
jgi:hypothetical protein